MPLYKQHIIKNMTINKEGQRAPASLQLHTTLMKTVIEKCLVLMHDAESYLGLAKENKQKRTVTV